jgi:hypothetical protein
MKNVVLLIVAALIVAGGYGYHKNPKACQKLGLDIVNDAKVIFTSTDATEPAAPVAAAVTAAAAVPAVPPSSAPAEAPVAPSPSPTPAPAPVSQVQPDSMAGNVLENGDFSAGDRLWEGDGRIDPSAGKALVVSLSAYAWTKVWQDFKGDKGTADTITIVYKVSPDIAPSDKAADYSDILNHLQFEDYKGYGSLAIPTGNFLVWIGDLTNHVARYERFPIKPDSGDTQKITHTFPTGAPFADKMVTLAFPPGTGNIVILSVSVTSN